MSGNPDSLAPAADTSGAAIATLAAQLARRAVNAGRRGACYIVGLCGAQGSGKSTLVTVLQRLLQAQGLAAVALSLEDFYLTRQQRAEFARRVHPLVQTRGVPGTHDIALVLKVIEALQRSGEVALP